MDGRNSSVDLTEETFMEALRAGAGSSLRQRMITILVGLVSRTQQNYIGAVRRLAAHYRRSPDRLNEEEVRAYLLALRDRGAAPSRSCITASSSCTARRLIVTGPCLSKKDSAA